MKPECQSALFKHPNINTMDSIEQKNPNANK